MDEIEQARRIHKSISDNLKNSQIILAGSNVEIFHTMKTPSGITEIQTLYLVETKQFLLISNLIQPSEFQTEWYRGGDHFLLMKMLEAGILPTGWSEIGTYANPPTLSNALELARTRGYQVPDEFLIEKPVSYSEGEAYHAAHMIARGHFPLTSNELTGDFDSFRHNHLCQLTGQFIVPDPIQEWKTPYIIDQLWITIFPNWKVRLIALEIDGEPHLKKESEDKDKKRDAMIRAMGYEVFHVAGWWCRVDPFRVILEFLHNARLFRNAHRYIEGAHFRTIGDYVCGYCHEPMVRWDVDWIQEVKYGGRTVTVHRKCAEKIRDNAV